MTANREQVSQRPAAGSRRLGYFGFVIVALFALTASKCPFVNDGDDDDVDPPPDPCAGATVHAELDAEDGWTKHFSDDNQAAVVPAGGGPVSFVVDATVRKIGCELPSVTYAVVPRFCAAAAADPSPGGEDVAASARCYGEDFDALLANVDFRFDYAASVDGSPLAAVMTIETNAAPGIYENFDLTVVDLPAGVTADPQPLLVEIVPIANSVRTFRVTKIAASREAGWALSEDGSVWAWGNNLATLLGDGSAVDRSTPVPIGGFHAPVADISAEFEHAMALLADGAVYTWGFAGTGAAASGRLGPMVPAGDEVCADAADNDDTPRGYRPRPRAVGRIEPDGRVCRLENVTAIAVGSQHSLALRQDGTVLSWGANDSGQLGQAGAEPAPVEGLPAAASAVTAGREFSLAVLPGGAVWGWGDNRFNQLGTNSAERYPAPVQVPGLAGVIELRSRSHHSLARIDGETGFRAWGLNSLGELGDGTTTSTGVPAPVNQALVVSQLSPAYTHGAALVAQAAFGDPGVYVWGTLPDASGEIPAPPLRVPELSGIAELATGGIRALSFTLARHELCGNVYARGLRDRRGALGGGGVQLDDVQRTLPVYGLGEASLPDGCEVALRIYQNRGGQVVASPGGLAPPGCSERRCGTALPVRSVVLLTAEPDEGYEFAGWRGDCSGVESSFLLVMDGSKNCFAQYRRPGRDEPPTALFTFSPPNPRPGQAVTFDASASGDDDAIESYEWDFEGNGSFEGPYDEPTIEFSFPQPGTYAAVLRVTDSGGQARTTTRSITVSAPTGAFSLDVLVTGLGSGRVTRTPGIGGSIDCTTRGTTCSAAFAAGASVPLTATADPGSEFSWGSDSDVDCFDGVVEMDADRFCEARFDLVSATVGVEIDEIVGPAFTVTGRVTSSPVGIDCGPGTSGDCSETYALNTVVVLNPQPADARSVFLGWNGHPDCAAAHLGGVTLDGSKLCIAVFDSAASSQRATLTVAAAGPGTVSTADGAVLCPGDCTEIYDFNETVLMTANPAAGQVLLGWAGDCASAGTTATFTLDLAGNKNCTASFGPPPSFTIDVNISNQGGSSQDRVFSTPPGIDCTAGSVPFQNGGVCEAQFSTPQVQLTAQPAGGDVLDQWGGVCAGQPAPAVCVIDNPGGGTEAVGVAFRPGP